ncbi:MAG: hypothetical protein ACQETH_10505 [Candidatus Rifleibacteriota bacterium]
MNAKISFVLVGLTGLLAFALIINPVSGNSVDKVAEIDSGKVPDCIKKIASSSNDMPGIKVLEVKGESYKVCSKKELTSLKPGIASFGYFKTSMQGYTVLSVNKNTILKLHPETEILITPYGSKWPDLVNCYLYGGEIDIETSSTNSRHLRVITDGICVNPGKVNFKMIFNSEIGSGEVIVKTGILRITSDKDPAKFFSVSTLFGIDFVDGKLKIPHKISIEDYHWSADS